MQASQTRVLIEKNLDIVKPNEVVSCNSQILTYVENQDGIEKILRGYQITAYLNDKEIEQCVKCKNGKDGWVEFIDRDMKIHTKKGDVKVYLCLSFEQGNKAPRVDINISDMKK